jgi:hypothetical protein
MTVNPISAASLSAGVLASSDSNQLQQALQILQNSLTSGNLNSAQSAFETVQTINQGLANASGSSLPSNSQLSTDLTALGSAIGSGNLATAQSLFATVKNDLKNSNSPSLTNEINTASQSAQLVQELLGTVNISGPSSSTSDTTTSVLEQVYGSSGALNVHA